MKTILMTALFIALHIGICTAEESYVIPPTDMTRGYVPVISDEMMEECVKIYNKSRWLSEKLESTHVNQYSQADVDRYNRKVHQVNSMTDWFNRNCAGKQSYSACEAAQKLNREEGRPVQPCR